MYIRYDSNNSMLNVNFRKNFSQKFISDTEMISKVSKRNPAGICFFQLLTKTSGRIIPKNSA